MLNPAFIDRMSWAMAEVYGSTTDRIIINLAKYFPYVKSPNELTGSFQYQAKMLAKMGKVNRETVDIIINSLGGADEALRKALEQSIMASLKDVEPTLRKAAQKGLLQGQGFLPPEVAPAQTRAFQALYKQSADSLNLVNTVMLESTQEAYRATVADVAQKMQRIQTILNTETGATAVGVQSYNQAVKQAVARMVDTGITGFVDHGGHRWSPEAYAAMDIRTTVTNAAREAAWERNEEYGNDLYLVSTHAGARPKCYPWQNKVVSRTDNARDIEDLYGNIIHVVAQSATSYGEPDGLFGINCKHMALPFVEGLNTLGDDPEPEDENNEQYAAEQKQRAMERDMRELKLREDVLRAQGADKDQIKAAEERVREQSQKIDAFCDEHGLPRRYSREAAPVDKEFPEDIRR